MDGGKNWIIAGIFGLLTVLNMSERRRRR